MLQDNRKLNQSVSPDTAFLEELRSKLPEFFTVDKYDEAGELLEAGGFDLQKFTSMLQERNIQELTSGYKLDFIGKDYAKKQAGERPTTVILPDKEHNAKPENRDSHNLFLTGENLEVLRHLQASYQNAVDVIYIDPPYNTGSDGFVYPDKFEYSDENLQAMFGLSEEELKRLKSIRGRASHSAWLTFMYPRLWLAKRLLKDSGVIFVSIDDNEQANLKLLMDEIFGEGQLAGIMLRKVIEGGKSDSQDIVRAHDYILVYKKTGEATISKEKQTNFDHYTLTDEYLTTRGKYYLKPLFTKGLGYVASLDYGIENKGETVYPNLDNNKEYRWVWEKNRVKQAIKNDIIVFNKNSKGETKVYYKTYEKVDSQGNYIERSQPHSSFLKDGVGNRQGKLELNKLFSTSVFDTPKPTSLLKILIGMVDVASPLILDFFAGSATTADAVMQLNEADGGQRRYIMVQLPEPTFTTNSNGTEVARKGAEVAYDAGYRSIDEISRKRIELASQKIQSESDKDLTDFDGGFKHYRVVSPTQKILDDLDEIDVSDSQQLSLLEEVDFSDMVTPFSATGLGYAGSACGEETILTTWLLADGYGFDVQTEQLSLAGYQATYLDRSRLYLISSGWTSEQTKALVNCLGTHELTLQTLVIYAYSFELESLRELELALNQLDSKPELLKRY